jgi:hypothetical protein
VRTQLRLTPRDQGRRLTLEEFEHSAGKEGYHYELIDRSMRRSMGPTCATLRGTDALPATFEGLLPDDVTPARAASPGIEGNAA